jgi:nitric oxide reductase large subunit
MNLHFSFFGGSYYFAWYIVGVGVEGKFKYFLGSLLLSVLVTLGVLN